MQKLLEVHQVRREGCKEQKVQRARGLSELRMIGALEDRDKLVRETATKPQDVVLEGRALAKVSMATGLLHLDDAARRAQVCV